MNPCGRPWSVLPALLVLFSGCVARGEGGGGDEGLELSSGGCCGTLAATLPSQAPACPVTGPAARKADLWTGGTCLRGAALWQERVPRRSAPGDSLWPSFDQTDFQELRAWNANLVVLSHPGIYGETDYRRNDTVLRNLLDLIGMAEQAKLYVVVALRTGPGRNEKALDGEAPAGERLRLVWSDQAEGRAARDAWARMWGELARELRHRSNVIGYELMVEPDSTHALWNPLAQAITDSIRKHDQDTPILVGAAGWSTACSLGCVDLLDDPAGAGRSAVVYTVHQYEPERYVRQTRPRRWDPRFQRDLQTRYRWVWGFAEARHVPVGVTEFGVFRAALQADTFFTEQVALIERIGANHALWNWEPADPSLRSDERMDFRRGTPALRTAIQNAWRRNGTVRP